MPLRNMNPKDPYIDCDGNMRLPRIKTRKKKSNVPQLIATVISDARARVLLRAAPANLPPACHTSLILMGNCPLSLALGRLVTQKFGMGETDYRRRGCRIIKNRRSSAIDLTIMEDDPTRQFAMRVFWVTLGIACTAPGTVLLMILLR